MDTSKILAKVGAVVITEADVNETIAALGQRGAGYNTPDGRRAVLDQLVAKNLFLAEAKKNFYEGDPKFKADLAKIKDEMLANFAIEKALSVVKVSEDEVKKFYDEHKSEFIAGESVEASHILVDNEEKAKVLYDFLDASSMFNGTVEKQFRSLMNVPFVTESAELDAEVVAATKAAGFDNLKGHRSVGGLRASIYNAMPKEGVEALVDFLKDFEAKH